MYFFNQINFFSIFLKVLFYGPRKLESKYLNQQTTTASSMTTETTNTTSIASTK